MRAVLAWVAALVLLAPGIAGAQPEPAAPIPPAAAPVEIIRIEAPGTGALDVRVAFRVGSAHDPRGPDARPGITALTARVMAAGDTARRSWPAVLEALYPMGASVQVYIGAEQVVFTGRCERRHVAAFVGLLAELLTEPAFADSDLRRVRAATRTELVDGLRTADDESLSRAVLDLALHPRHPYDHLPDGTVGFLDAVTADDLRAWYRRAFVRGAVQIAIGGEGLDAAEALLRAAVERLPPGDPPTLKIPRATEPAATRAVLVERDAPATAISIGFPLDVRRGDPDFVPLLVAASWLGEHRQLHGRLFQRMRAARGLNYGDYAYAEHFEQDGHSIRPRTNVARSRQSFSLWIRPVPHPMRAFAIKLAVWELRRLIARGIDQEELDAARDFLMGYSRVLEETVMRRLGSALDDRFYGTPPFLAQLRAALPAVTKEQVDAAVRRHLRGDRLTIVAVTRGARELAKELLAAERTQIRYGSPKPPEILREDEEVGALDVGLTNRTIRIVHAEDLFEGPGLPR